MKTEEKDRTLIDFFIKSLGVRQQDQEFTWLQIQNAIFDAFEKVSFLKETPTIATDNTLPPSSPTATAEPEDKGKRAKAKNVFIRVYQQWYGTGSNYKNNDGDLLSHDDMIFQAMNEFATQEKQQARRQIIEAINAAIQDEETDEEIAAGMQCAVKIIENRK